MTDKLAIYPRPIVPVSPGGGGQGATPTRNSGGASFEDLLNAQVQRPRQLQFSRHAQSRLESRGIELGPEAMSRLQNAVQQVGSKGGRDSLVLLDDTALVVSVKNSTVVTVVDKEQLKGNVFTNIDSAVIA